MGLQEASYNCSDCVHYHVCSYITNRANICNNIKDIDCGNLFRIIVECKEFKYKNEQNVKTWV